MIDAQQSVHTRYLCVGVHWGQSGFVQIQRDTVNGNIGVCAVNEYPTFVTC